MADLLIFWTGIMAGVGLVLMLRPDPIRCHCRLLPLATAWTRSIQDGVAHAKTRCFDLSDEEKALLRPVDAHDFGSARKGRGEP